MRRPAQLLFRALAILVMAGGCGGSKVSGVPLDATVSPDSTPETGATDATIEPDSDAEIPTDSSEAPDTDTVLETDSGLTVETDATETDVTMDADSRGPDGDTDPGTDSEDAEFDTTAPVSCVIPSDCEALLLGSCQTARCDDNLCRVSPAVDETSCDDGNACTEGDRCVTGACLPLSARLCDDDKACTDDRCDPALGCRFEPNLAACEDGDPCTTEDRCAGGLCLAGTPTCDDGESCTQNVCEPATGACSFPADDAATCDDGSPCTEGDRCLSGGCVAGASDGCESDNPCVTSVCGDDGVSCLVTPNDDIACSDGSVCTDGDLCQAGQCVPGPALDCGGDPDCIQFSCDAVTGCMMEGLSPNVDCDDGDRCTGTGTCDAIGNCIVTTLVDCDDNRPCTIDSCNPAQGCRHTTTSGADCDDDNVCTDQDRCLGSTCRGTQVVCDDDDMCSLDRCDPLTGCESVADAIDCDDGNPCTDDRCDGEDGCISRPNTADCDDGDPCTRDDQCASGACGGRVDDCDDANACTLDICDPEEGCVSVATVSACEDGDLCTEGETCSDGINCMGGVSVITDDAVACTVDACTSDVGVTHTPDAGACPTGQTCDPEAGCVDVTPLVLITQLMLDPGVDNTEPGYGQWVVLTNLTPATIDLAGWTLRTGTPLVDLPLAAVGSDTTIAPGEAVAMVKATADAPPAPMMSFAFTFGAAGDGLMLPIDVGQLALVRAGGGLADVINLASVSAGPTFDNADFPVVAGRPMVFDGRLLSAADSSSANDPGRTWCLAASSQAPVVDRVAGSACATPVLNEVRLGGTDPGSRWVELFLPPGGSFNGLRLVVVEADGDAEFERVLTGRMPLDAAFLVRDGSDNVALPQLPDGAVQLVRETADGPDLLDVYGFGVVTEDTDSARLLPVREAGAGPAQGETDVAERATDGVDTDDNAADWLTGLDGSPGLLNSSD